MSAFASFMDWVAIVEPDAKVPHQGVAFWHQMGANSTAMQLLPDTFAVGLSTQVTEGWPWVVLLSFNRCTFVESRFAWFWLSYSAVVFYLGLFHFMLLAVA